VIGTWAAAVGQLVGLVELAGLAADFRDCRPMKKVKALDLVFESRFEILFEFESHSHSNPTQLNSQLKASENPTHIIYHNLNLCFYKWAKRWRI
jgi:hypothetical protein